MLCYSRSNGQHQQLNNAGKRLHLCLGLWCSHGNQRFFSSGVTGLLIQHVRSGPHYTCTLLWLFVPRLYVLSTPPSHYLLGHQSHAVFLWHLSFHVAMSAIRSSWAVVIVSPILPLRLSSGGSGPQALTHMQLAYHLPFSPCYLLYFQGAQGIYGRPLHLVS